MPTCPYCGRDLPEEQFDRAGTMCNRCYYTQTVEEGAR